MYDLAILLIKTKIFINKYDINGKSALMYAIEKNNVDLVKLLLDYNANIPKKTLTMSSNPEINALLKLRYKTFSQKYFCLY